MDTLIKHANKGFASQITPSYAKPTKSIKLYDILDHVAINFNIGKSCAISTANNIGYSLETYYYSNPDFKKGYAQSLGYIHGINGKEKNWSKSTIVPTHIEHRGYNSVHMFEKSAARRGRIMNAVNSKHTFIVSDDYKLDYTFGWLYGQYQMRYQHDTYSLEQQGFIHAQTDTILPDGSTIPSAYVGELFCQIHTEQLLTKNNTVTNMQNSEPAYRGNTSLLNKHTSITNIHPKFILGFCAGMGYRDYRNFNIKKIVTFSEAFDKLGISKNRCQIYYDMFYVDTSQF
jgi:hypothetical protein